MQTAPPMRGAGRIIRKMGSAFIRMPPTGHTWATGRADCVMARGFLPMQVIYVEDINAVHG